MQTLEDIKKGADPKTPIYYIASDATCPQVFIWLNGQTFHFYRNPETKRNVREKVADHDKATQVTKLDL